MSEQIREQVSAFLDGELPGSETELLLKRLTRDVELRDSFGRYALIGEALRGGGGARLSRDFPIRVNGAIDGETQATAQSRAPARKVVRWWRPAAGVAVAAGVMAIAVGSFRQRAEYPASASQVTAIRSASTEALSYTVPAAGDPGAVTSNGAGGAARAPMAAARLASYVFAHSPYSSVLGQRNVLSGLLTVAEEQEGGVVPDASGDSVGNHEVAGARSAGAPDGTL